MAVLNMLGENLAAKARKAYFALKRKLPFDSNLSPNLWLKLYNSIIVPILTYSSEIWISDFKTNHNNFDKTPFEKNQNFILRNILGVHNKASNLATKLELGVLPIHVKIYQLAIKYYSRMNNLIKSNDNHNVLLRNAYLEDKQLYIKNKK